MVKKLYDKRNDFSFRIVNFSFICVNIPSAPANGVFISHHNSYFMQKFLDFLYRGRQLIIRLLGQGYVATKLKSSLQKLYGRHHELYGVSICTMAAELFES